MGKTEGRQQTKKQLVGEKGERGKTLMIEKIDTPDHFTLLGSYVCYDNCLDTQ